MSEFIKNTPGNGQFLYSAFQNYTNTDIIDFLKNQGLEVKEERGNRIFPVTDKSIDVLNCFKKRIDELKIGDEVYIFSLDKKMRYCVYQTKVVLPYEINDLKIIDGKDLLTLVTCTPYGINTHRLLVQCERAEINESDKKIDIKEDFIVDNVFQSMNDKYWIFIFCDIIIFLIIVFCCILLNKIVKYIQKVRNKE